MSNAIVPFGAEDVAASHGLSAKIKWPHRLEDWQFAVRIGQGYVARDNGVLQGTCLTWAQEDGVASLGLLIVAEEAGGRGLGRALLRKCLSDHADSSIVLHATNVAVPLYLSEGFAPLGWIVQCQGTVADPAAGAEVAPVDPAISLRALGAADYDQIFALDRAANGFGRQQVLAETLKHSSGVLAMCGDKLAGYALSRPFGRGAAIGPVVAEDEALARCIIAQLLKPLSGKFARIDLIADAMTPNWLEVYGLSEVDRVQIMANGPLPKASGKARKFALIGHAYG